MDQQTVDTGRRHRGAFKNSPVAIWEEDFSVVYELLEEFRSDGVRDLRAHLEAHPCLLDELIRSVRVSDVNTRTVELFEAPNREALLSGLHKVFLEETRKAFLEELLAFWEGRNFYEGETVIQTLKGNRVEIMFQLTFQGDRGERSLICIQDVTEKNAIKRALEVQRRRWEILNAVAQTVSSDLDLERIVQDVTDIATELVEAKFGAFFYTVVNETGESLLLYALSGAPREAFESFGMPRNTAVFDPTFRGEGIVRSDDIRTDPRYGKIAPHFGMPEGHLPVASYLAVPVISRSGDVIGGLFFGHPEAAKFSEESERLVLGIAAHAAVAIDNASLHQAAHREITARKTAERDAQRLAAIVEHSDDAILSKDLEGLILTWNHGAEQLFGYTEKEVLGKPITIIVPEDRLDEEQDILARVRSGMLVKELETVRRHKDGHLIDVSLAVSPIKDADGNVVGASGISRSIADRKIAEERQSLLLREMGHRIKNLFAVTSSLMSLSARHSETPEDLAQDVQGRLAALIRAHELTRPGLIGIEDAIQSQSTLHNLVETILAPYIYDGQKGNVEVSGADINISGSAATNMALVIHEFATNAAKYGALEFEGGLVTVQSQCVGGDVVITWREEANNLEQKKPSSEGFGSVLVERIVERQFGGTITKSWDTGSLIIEITLPITELGS